MKGPLVSVVMSVFNAEDFLKESIDSILGQTFQDFEFIIINDGSTDESEQILKSYSDTRIRLLNQENRGLSYSLNKGIDMARGFYIARMDADDISHPERLEKQVSYLRNNGHCILVGCNAHYIDCNGNHLYTSSNPLDFCAIKKKLPESSFFHSSVLYKKSAWSEAGRYREDIFHHFEDKLLWVQMSKLGELRNLEEALLKYRLVPYSISNIDLNSIKSLRKIATRILTEDQFTELHKMELLKATRFSKKKKKGLYYLRLGLIYLNENFDRQKAFTNLVRAFRLSPLKFQIYFNMLLTLLPKSLIMLWKKRGKFTRLENVYPHTEN